MLLLANARRGQRSLAGALVPIFTLLILASCGAAGAGRDPGPQDDIGEAYEEPEDRTSAAQEKEVTITELSRNPEEFYGQRVTVSATVARVFQSGVFSLVTEEPPEDEEPIEDEGALVVGADGSRLDLSEEEAVRVTGEVRRMDRSEIEQDLGFDLDEDLAAYDDQPVVVAESVETLPDEATRQEDG